MSADASEPAPKLVSPAILRLLDDERDPVSFVEIGANDGVSFDPLAPFVSNGDWRGVMVEPVPHVFGELVANHGDNPRLTLVNAAVDAVGGKRVIHHLRPDAHDPALPVWAQQIASFDREHVIRELSGADDPDSLVTGTEVECLTFATLCERHGIRSPDLVLIDAEGADLEILESIDLDRLRPRVLAYEHEHMSAADRARGAAILAGSGYEVVSEGLDSWALDLVPDDSLSERWRRVLSASASR